MRRTLYATIFLILYILLASTVTSAENTFNTDYSITYDVNESGVTTVYHKISITNLKEDLIATNYSLGLKQLDVFDVTAEDDSGKLEVIQKLDGEFININVSLRTFVVGVGKQNSVTIVYKSKQIATKVGEVWNVNIPRSQPISGTTTTSINLSIPNTFGEKIFVSPQPATVENKDGKTIYGFANEQLKNANITAAFGKFQILNFKLKYQIENSNLFSSVTEIAIPMDIPSTQLIEYESISPAPLKRFVDGDGNLMATYKLNAKQKLEITLVGSAKIKGKQINPKDGGLFKDVPSEILNVYTRPLTHWESDAESVKNISAELINPNETVAENAFKIYNYLIENYSYDFNISKKEYVDRKGASAALVNKAEWGCMEFTDAFIAIARNSGIPAREINGYALTSVDTQRPLSVTFKSGDLLHAWPEFYDPKLGWIQVDPTWGDTSNTDYFTKLDTNHLVFVRKGIKSDYPLPAGAYRTSPSEKLVEVSYSQSNLQPAFGIKYEVKKIPNLNIFQYLAGKRRYLVTNIGNTVIYEKNGLIILPQNSKKIYVAKKQSAVSFHNSFGEEKTTTLAF